MKQQTATEKTTSKKPRYNRPTGEPRRVHNFRLSNKASDKLKKLAAANNISQGAIIEYLIFSVI